MEWRRAISGTLIHIDFAANQGAYGLYVARLHGFDQWPIA
jgi:hypothetical protein